jgi:hypothetical protein
LSTLLVKRFYNLGLTPSHHHFVHLLAFLDMEHY